MSSQPPTTPHSHPLKRPLLFCALIAFIIRFLYLTEQTSSSVLFNQPTLDEQEMVLTAEAIRSGEGFGPTPLFKAPLYPLFMAGCQTAFGDHWFWGIRFLQHMGGVLLVMMAADAASRLAGGSVKRRQMAAAFAGGLLAVYAPLIRLESRLILDFSVVLLQSALLWALIRSLDVSESKRKSAWLATAGCFAALAWLTRPTLTPALPVLAVLAAWLGLEKNQRTPLRLSRYILLFMLPPLLAMGAVCLRNTIVAGDPMILPWQGGYNLYHANRPGANGRYLLQEKFSTGTSANPTQHLMVEGYETALRNGDASPHEKGRYYSGLQNYWMDLTKEAIFSAPLKWTGLMMQKGVYLFNDREIYNFEDYALHKNESQILRILPLGFGWLIPLALAAMALPLYTEQSGRNMKWMVVGTFVVTAGCVALVFVSGRLRMPLVFPVTLLAAGALSAFIDSVKKKKPLRFWLLPSLLFGLGLMLAWIDWWGVRSEVVVHHDLARLSNAAWRQGQPETALDYALRAEAVRPDYWRLHQLKGQALFSLGNLDAAAAAFRKAKSIQPKDPVPVFNLAVITYNSSPDPQQARVLFEETLALQPSHSSANIYLALCHLRAGNISQARELLDLAHAGNRNFISLIAEIAILQAEGNRQEAESLFQKQVVPLGPEAVEMASKQLKRAMPYNESEVRAAP